VICISPQICYFPDTMFKKKKTVIVKRSQHTISRKNIDQDALKVIRRLHSHGYKAYLVGGGVRDLLLGREPKDFDVSTDAHPNQIKKIFRNCFLVGRRFRLAHIRFGRDKIIETSTFRRQPELPADPNDPGASLIQKNDNTFGTPQEDAMRRDLTINGLFYDPRTFNLIDHVNGLPDLKKGIIRSIGNPNIRFREDPVRMLRAVRFAARLGFTIEPKTYKAILRHHTEIINQPPARLLEEIYRLFGFGSAEASFFLLWQTKLLEILIPEVDAYLAANGKADAPLWRFLAALDSGEHFRSTPTQPLMLAALLCDPVAKVLHGEKLNLAERHQAIAELIEPIALRYKIPRRIKYRLIQILTDLYRLEQTYTIRSRPQNGGKRKRGMSPQKIASRESFPETLALLELSAAAGCTDPAATAFWQKVAATVEPAPPRASKPRRRRRRPPRSANESAA